MWNNLKEALYIVPAITTIIAEMTQIAENFKKNIQLG